MQLLPAPFRGKCTSMTIENRKIAIVCFDGTGCIRRRGRKALVVSGLITINLGPWRWRRGPQEIIKVGMGILHRSTTFSIPIFCNANLERRMQCG